MKYAALAPAFLLATLTAMQPAAAQSNPIGGNPSGMNNPAAHAPVHTLENAPPALPGAGVPAPATGPVVQAPITGDPTTALFTAINNADYNAAQDAISRGADMTAQNSLGETPLDLSIALNRNTITFLLLSARNEVADGGGPQGPVTAQPAVAAAKPSFTTHATPARAMAPTHSNTLSNNPGTPDPSAGFLGFGPTK
jgi:hypothetical protein